MRVSENDVIDAYAYMITEACAGISCIEPDDRRQICRLALLYAVRTWRTGMIPFEVYARRCIAEALKQEERLCRTACRAEARLSLDMTIGYEQGHKTTYADIIAAYEDDYSAIDMNDFLRQHQRKLKRGGYAALRNEAATYFFA